MAQRDVVLGLVLAGLLLGVGVYAPEPAPAVESIRLHTTGGLMGVNETIVIEDGNITQVSERRGRTTARLNRTMQLRAVGAVRNQSFTQLANGTSYGCQEGYAVADVFTYRLTVAYTTGTKQLTFTCGLHEFSAAPPAAIEAVRTVQMVAGATLRYDGS